MPKKAENNRATVEMGYPLEVVHLKGVPRVGSQQAYVMLRFHDPCYPEHIWPREKIHGGTVR
jgi:hypothetical protein